MIILLISVFLELRYVLGNLELSFFVQVEVLEKSPSNKETDVMNL